jgi:hypothetical protein
MAKEYVDPLPSIELVYENHEWKRCTVNGVDIPFRDVTLECHATEHPHMTLRTIARNLRVTADGAEVSMETLLLLMDAAGAAK